MEWDIILNPKYYKISRGSCLLCDLTDLGVTLSKANEICLCFMNIFPLYIFSDDTVPLENVTLPGFMLKMEFWTNI